MDQTEFTKITQNNEIFIKILKFLKNEIKLYLNGF